MKVLVVAAHPDDEVLGCGGTLARFYSEYTLDIVILGEGMSSRYERRAQVEAEELSALHEISRQVASKLGARELYLLGMPDNRFDEMALLDVTKQIEHLIDNLQPSLIFTHHPGDLNIDHAITFRAVLTATRPVSGCSVREIYAFEVPSSTEWAFQRLVPPFRPNVFMDITDTIDAKIEAMQAYESESRAFPHPRSPEALRAIARRWGSVAGVGYAEAFELIRSIR